MMSTGRRLTDPNISSSEWKNWNTFQWANFDVLKLSHSAKVKETETEIICSCLNFVNLFSFVANVVTSDIDSFPAH